MPVIALVVALLNLKQLSRRRAWLVRTLLVLTTLLTVSVQVIDDASDKRGEQEATARESELRGTLALAENDHARIQTEVDTLQRMLAPFQVLATHRYPELELGAAMERLAIDVRRLEARTESLSVLVSRDQFHPLARPIRQRVVSSIAALRTWYVPSRMIVDVSYAKDNGNRIQLGRELVAILAEAGVVVRDQPTVVLGSRGPVAITVDDEDQVMFERIATILHPLLGGDVSHIIEKGMGVGATEIALTGIPTFSADGTVTFK